MKKTNISALISSAAISLLIFCSSKSGNDVTGPAMAETMGTTVRILTSPYSVTPSTGAMTVTIAEYTECNGSSAVVVPAVVKTGTYSIAADGTLRLSLNLLMAGMSAIPTVDSATFNSFSGIVDTIAQAQGGFVMDGVFARASGTGLGGDWAFTGLSLAPEIQAMIAILGMRAQVDSTIGKMTGSEGHRVFFISIDSTEIVTLADKNWYGHEMVFGIVDTAAVGVTVSQPNVSQWKAVGRTTPETVTIDINSEGDLLFTSSYPAYSNYTYVLHPILCPDAQTPLWWAGFLAANPH